MKKWNIQPLITGKTVIGALLILLLVTGYVFLSRSNDASVRKSVEAPPRKVLAQLWKVDAHAPYILGTGTVRAKDTYSLIPEVSGKVISDRSLMEVGRNVKKGELLVQLEGSAGEARYKSSIADLTNALARFLPELKRDFPESYGPWYHFLEKLEKGRLPSLPQISEEKKVRLERLLNRFRIFPLYLTAESQWIHWQKHTIRAPFDGVVIDSKIYGEVQAVVGQSLGSLVGVGGPLEVVVPTTLDNALHLKAGQSVFLPSKEREEEYAVGTISHVGGGVRATDQMVSVLVDLDKRYQEHFSPGVFIEVAFRGDVMDSTFSVPRQSLVGEGSGQERIWLIQDGKLQGISVVVRHLGPKNVLVQPTVSKEGTLGINQGDTVVIEAMPYSLAGIRVSPQWIKKSNE
jgi:multidrug efflux pump subunit AcrA (membrane-fusion protein)